MYQVSDDLYNLIQNANSLEDLQSIKSSVTKATYNYLNYDKSYIGIRALSKEEYDKYLINGTLNGSITARNENVWHLVNGQDIIMFWQRYDQDKYTDAEIFNYVKGFVQHFYSYNNIKTYKVIRIQTSQKNGVASFGNIYYSIKQDNKTNTTLLIPDKQILYCFACSWGYVSDMQSWVSDSSNKDYTCFYNEFYKNIAKNSNNIYDSRGVNWRGSGYGRSANINFVTCFRPVFQYKDNNKSNNIYY